METVWHDMVFRGGGEVEIESRERIWKNNEDCIEDEDWMTR
jgi:hypothetical protein